MKTYRFVATTHQDVAAETLEGAVAAFNKGKQAGLSPKVGTVRPIEVRDEKGEYVPVDQPLRGEYLTTIAQAEIRLSA